MSEAASAGTLLRQAREAAGLHVASLAVALKVPVRKLEALERDQYDQLPDAVFARALASSVCRTLKIDPQPVLERLPQTHAPRLVQDQDGLNAPFRAPGDGAAPGWIDHLNKPMVLAVFALLLGALVLVFLPTVRHDDAAVANSSTAAAPLIAPALPAAGPAIEQPVAASPDTVPVPRPSESAAVVPATTPGAGGASAGAVANTPAHAASAVQKSAAAASAPLAKGKAASMAAAAAAPASAPSAAAPAPASTGVVVFKATGPSWVEVTDSRGGVALRRLMAAGETAGASGNLPLAVTVGSANATSVQVRGKPYNLAPVSHDNVARFEVK